MVEQLRRDSAVPLYAQIEQVLRGKIADGSWQPGDRIPSENELNRMFGVSRMTARGVLTQLVNDGLLFRVAGKGTYVADRKINTQSPAYQGIREQLESMGYQTGTRLISMTRTRARATVRDRLQIDSGAEVFAIERVRSVNGEPISLHRSFVPVSLAPTLAEFDPEREQLCTILAQNFSLDIKHVEEHLESVPVGTEDARLLGIRRNAPVLLLTDLIRDVHRRPFEYSTILFRGDKIRLGFSYEL